MEIHWNVSFGVHCAKECTELFFSLCVGRRMSEKSLAVSAVRLIHNGTNKFETCDILKTESEIYVLLSIINRFHAKIHSVTFMLINSKLSFKFLRNVDKCKIFP